MPQINDHADLFRDWESLIEAVIRNAGRLPGFEPFIAVLQDFVAQAKATKAEQEQQMGLRKATTQQLDYLLDRGKEGARKVRRFILLHYDSRDQQLTQFGITPFETRVRRTATEPTKPAPETATAKPAQEAAKPAEETASAPASSEETTTDKPVAAEPAK